MCGLKLCELGCIMIGHCTSSGLRIEALASASYIFAGLGFRGVLPQRLYVYQTFKYPFYFCTLLSLRPSRPMAVPMCRAGSQRAFFNIFLNANLRNEKRTGIFDTGHHAHLGLGHGAGEAGGGAAEEKRGHRICCD